ncbi:PH domain-containing protein [Rhodococcus sp. AW25M09]|uniref:PH domain-containing protein n=1 Tax=Rhodococcus sp. AW25M09 TaxID=1268303 RepID=UPI0009DB4700|nr:PH domain-containing protein [Rhodococcus sp. AW25M09]
MLLVHPVNEAIKILPVLLVSFFLGSQSGNHFWSLGILAVVVVFAILRWFTTSYRIGPVHVQLRSGVLQKKLLSIPRNRIRSVDVEANVLHRVLGLSILRIGTGQQAGKGEAFELNALDTSLVPALRGDLLQRVSGQIPATDGMPTAATDPGVEIAHWQFSWVRFAPFSITGIVTIAAAVGVLFQYGLGQRLAESSVVSNSIDSAEQFGIAMFVVAALVALLVVSSIFACVRYLLTYGNLTVTDQGRTLHVSHGLLRTRQSTLDRKRLRGTSLSQPLLLRAVNGAGLDAIMTGVSAEKKESSLLLPQAPRVEALRMMTTVLGDAGLHGAAERPLLRHGPAARRRRYTRALAPLLVLAAGVGIAQYVGAPIPLLVWIVLAMLFVAGVGLAHDRYRGLGHAVLPGWLITQHGSLDRSRHSLEAAGIIGWTVRQTFFQRRAGVATIVAATPAGVGHYEVVDIPVENAWAMIDAVTPGAGDIWLRRN